MNDQNKRIYKWLGRDGAWLPYNEELKAAMEVLAAMNVAIPLAHYSLEPYPLSCTVIKHARGKFVCNWNLATPTEVIMAAWED